MNDKDQKLEYQQMEFQVYLAEYNQLRSEIQKRLDYLDKIVYYYLVILLGVATASKVIATVDDYLILSATLSLNILGVYYAANLYLMNKLNKYLADVLQPKVALLVKSYKVLEWETHILKQEFINTWKLKVGLLFTYFWVLLIPLVILAFMFCTKLITHINMSNFHSVNKIKLLLAILNVITFWAAYMFCGVSKNLYEMRKK